MRSSVRCLHTSRPPTWTSKFTEASPLHRRRRGCWPVWSSQRVYDSRERQHQENVSMDGIYCSAGECFSSCFRAPACTYRVYFMRCAALNTANLLCFLLLACEREERAEDQDLSRLPGVSPVRADGRSLLHVWRSPREHCGRD